MTQHSIILIFYSLCLFFIMIACETQTPTENLDKDQATGLDNQSQSRLSNRAIKTPLPISGVSCVNDWSYAGEPDSTGPFYWGSLNTQYALCDNGLSQSPINIVTNQVKQQPIKRLKFTSTKSDMKVKHCGQAIRIDINGKGRASISLDGKLFHLDHIHAHSPSEHQINGKHAPLEFHMVHRADDGQIAVIGVLVKEGSHHEHLEKFWSRLPELFPYSDGSKAIIVKKFDIKTLLPEESRLTYRYNGSLTTPPCSEGLQWIVMQEPIQMTTKQIRVHNDFFHTPNANPFPNGNRRIIQPLQGRKVVTEKTDDNQTGENKE